MVLEQQQPSQMAEHIKHYKLPAGEKKEQTKTRTEWGRRREVAGRASAHYGARISAAKR
jgi:hypothetical protein